MTTAALPDPTPLTVRWDREVIWDDQRGPTIVCCLADDGRPVALFLDDELREALGAALIDPPWDDEDTMDGFEDDEDPICDRPDHPDC